MMGIKKGEALNTFSSPWNLVPQPWDSTAGMEKLGNNEFYRSVMLVCALTHAPIRTHAHTHTLSTHKRTHTPCLDETFKQTAELSLFVCVCVSVCVLCVFFLCVCVCPSIWEMMDIISALKLFAILVNTHCILFLWAKYCNATHPRCCVFQV